jgi:hypothetical protein
MCLLSANSTYPPRCCNAAFSFSVKSFFVTLASAGVEFDSLSLLKIQFYQLLLWQQAQPVGMKG